MTGFLIEYWVEVLCGAVVTGLGLFFKKFLTMYHNEINSEREEIQNHLKKLDELDGSYANEISHLKEDINNVREDLKEMTRVQNQALLSIQGSSFRNKCRRYLDPNYDLQVEEYEQLSTDYGVYKSLGGNHGGDQLYALIKEKMENQKVL